MAGSPWTRLLWATGALFLFAGTRSTSAQSPQAPVNDAIRAIIENKDHPDLRWPSLEGYDDELRALYEPGAYGLVWLQAGRPRPAARQMIDQLLDAKSFGLDPEDYDAAKLDAAERTFASGATHRPEELALFDTALTMGALRLISDLHFGRVNPRNLHFKLEIDPKKADLAKTLLDGIATSRIPEMVAADEPQLAVYQRLKLALKTYRRLAEEPATPLPVVKKVDPGGRYEGLEALRSLLVKVGDLPATAAATSPADPNAASLAPSASSAAGSNAAGTAPHQPVTPDPNTAKSATGPSTVYEGDIVDGVKRFQIRHGLAADGVLGPATFESLNTPFSACVEQIKLSLERLRWLPDVGPGRAILVNIPAFRLYGFEGPSDHGKVLLRMNVVVGRSMSRTPIFAQKMKYIVFRPYWNVPYGITAREMIPKIRKDVGYLEAEQLEMVPGKTGDSAAALPVTEENIAKLATGEVRLRQRPGPHNSLGPAKFIFPNSANVYLHGTPAQSLFQKPRRDFSHGCVRVEDPAGLAEWILSGQPDWPREKIEAAMQGAKPTQVNLAEPMQVFLFYTTAAVDAEGRVFFWKDVYGHDKVLEEALAQGYPFPP